MTNPGSNSFPVGNSAEVSNQRHSIYEGNLTAAAPLHAQDSKEHPNIEQFYLTEADYNLQQQQLYQKQQQEEVAHRSWDNSQDRGRATGSIIHPNEQQHHRSWEGDVGASMVSEGVHRGAGSHYMPRASDMSAQNGGNQQLQPIYEYNARETEAMPPPPPRTSQQQHGNTEGAPAEKRSPLKKIANMFRGRKSRSKGSEEESSIGQLVNQQGPAVVPQQAQQTNQMHRVRRSLIHDDGGNEQWQRGERYSESRGAASGGNSGGVVVAEQQHHRWRENDGF